METTDTLYDRLGGAAAIDAALALMFDKLLADPRLAPYFEKVNVARHFGKVSTFVCAALGGPQVYLGKDMRTAHARLSISADEFGRVAGHLGAALDELGVPDDLAAELLAVVGSLAPAVVADERAA